MTSFSLLPTPECLQWLSSGQWTNRLSRSLRFYYLLWWLYGAETSRAAQLPSPFRYQDLAQQLFAPSHARDETASAEALTISCRDTGCLCQQSGESLLFNWVGDRADWLVQAAQLSGLGEAELEKTLQQAPFAVVHRVLRDDLQRLAQRGWLRPASRGKWTTVAEAKWPQPPKLNHSAIDAELLPSERLLLLRSLGSIAFVQPQLEVILDKLWRQAPERSAQPQVFTHLDYILPDDVQEQVDSHQEQIEALWRSADGGVIQFENWNARRQQSAQVTVYPVCIHYARRAKCLSTYGRNPDGRVGWYNYRLDRILSPRLKVLPWGNAQVPAELKQRRNAGQLPTPAQVQAQLDEAWGFNFYLPKALLIMRFAPEFARWYVQDTVRHPTFSPIAYEDIEPLVCAQVADGVERSGILQVLAERVRTDAYFWGWIRVGDTNVTMRLRDWRPQGEAIAPLMVRRQMMEEAQAELENYGILRNTLI